MRELRERIGVGVHAGACIGREVRRAAIAARDETAGEEHVDPSVHRSIVPAAGSGLHLTHNGSWRRGAFTIGSRGARAADYGDWFVQWLFALSK
jgi:hypothetical protein